MSADAAVSPERSEGHKGCDPVGSSDIAARLDVQVATVKMWRHRGLLPEPEWTVSGRPCWNWSSIQAWASSTGRLR